MEPTEPLAAEPGETPSAAKRSADAWDDLFREAPRRRPVAENRPPVRWREIAAVLLLVVLCDATIYRGYGFAGYAVLFAAAPRSGARLAAPAVGAELLPHRHDVGPAGGEVALVRIGGTGRDGVCLVPGLRHGALRAMPLRVSSPGVRVADDCGGVRRVEASRAVMGQDRRAHRPRRWLNIALPAAALCVFGLLFALANPDLLTFLGDKIQIFFRTLQDWLLKFAPGAAGDHLLDCRDLAFPRAAAAGH